MKTLFSLVKVKPWYYLHKSPNLHMYSLGILTTVFPHIVSAETILFWLLPYVLWPLITVHKCAETIQGRKPFKGGNYMRKYGMQILSDAVFKCKSQNPRNAGPFVFRHQKLTKAWFLKPQFTYLIGYLENGT